MKDIPEERKIYRRWRYEPSEDKVYLDKKKAELRGYAVRLDGGWRVTDIDHNSMTDLYLVRKVMETLRGDKREASAPMDYDFSVLHYGQPMPIKNK